MVGRQRMAAAKQRWDLACAVRQAWADAAFPGTR